VAPASPQGCGGECSAIFREAVAWVAKTRSVAPARLLLDTLESGRLSYTGPHVVPRSLLTDLTVSSAVGGRGTVDTMAQCFGSPFRPVPESCQPLADKIMVTLYAPVLDDSNPKLASLTVTENWNAGQNPRGRRFWAKAGFRLTLQYVGNSWHVIDAQRVFQN